VQVFQNNPSGPGYDTRSREGEAKRVQEDEKTRRPDGEKEMKKEGEMHSHHFAENATKYLHSHIHPLAYGGHTVYGPHAYNRHGYVLVNSFG
jgi:hypothetical protein